MQKIVQKQNDHNMSHRERVLYTDSICNIRKINTISLTFKHSNEYNFVQEVLYNFLKFFKQKWV